MSKGEILRGFVTERLAAAAQEILEAVDGIVAGYEEEAAGFRQEIERQRRQLELLLQRQLAHSRAGVKRSRSLGPAEEEEGEDEEDTECPEDQTDSTCHIPSSGQSEQRKPGRPQISRTQSHVNVRIRILEDAHIDVLSNSVLKNCPVLKLRCPPGLTDAAFLHLLKSSFPQLSGDKRFDILTSNERKRLQPFRLKALSADGSRGNTSGWAKSTLYIRLKTTQEPQTCEELPQRPARHTDASRRASGTLTWGETRPHTRSTSQQDKEGEEAGNEDYGMSEPAAGEQHRDREREAVSESGGDRNPDESKQLTGSDSETHTAPHPGSKTAVRTVESGEAPYDAEAVSVQRAWSEPGSVCGACGELSESLTDHQSCHRTEDRHGCSEALCVSGRASKCEVCREASAALPLEDQKAEKVFELEEEALKADRKAHLCGECGKRLCDYRSLSRHKMTHSEERPHGCQVCGRRFKLPGTLRQHEKIHTDRERSFLCHVCCKMFLTGKQLQIHLRTHSDEKPYRCGECGKGFTTKGPLTIHMRVHTGETPYRCPDCGWAFKRKLNLDNHMRVHSGHKPFVCAICGKACARKTYLTVHMRTHNGERPYKCGLCDKAFTQSHCLKTHMKSHQGAPAGT